MTHPPPLVYLAYGSLLLYSFNGNLSIVKCKIGMGNESNQTFRQNDMGVPLSNTNNTAHCLRISCAEHTTTSFYRHIIT
jgi:hypothetical protein